MKKSILLLFLFSISNLFSNNMVYSEILFPNTINGIDYKNWQPPHNIDELNEVLQRETIQLQTLQNDRRKDFEKNSVGYQNYVKDLEYQTQKVKNIDIVKKKYENFLTNKDESQNPFSEKSRFEVDEFNVYLISTESQSLKKIIVLSGSIVSPQNNSIIRVDIENQNFKIEQNNILSRRINDFQEKAYKRMNEIINQVMYNQF